MKVAIGLKAHSGWAVSIVIGHDGGAFHLVDRRRIDLIEPEDTPWAKAPYHAADGLPIAEACELVARGIQSAHAGSERSLRAVAEAMRAQTHDVVACALLVGSSTMPEWTTEQILAVHVRMHKAEGALFPAALKRAATVCGITLVPVRGKELAAEAQRVFGNDASRRQAVIAKLGKAAGPPWGADQKNAALAAMIALAGVS